MPNNMAPVAFDGYQFYTTQSEFNASIFVPNFANDMEMQLPGMKKPFFISFVPASLLFLAKKTQSLMDLRFNDTSSILGETYPSHYVSSSMLETSSAIIPNYALSLDRKPHRSSKIPKYASVDALNDLSKGTHVIRNRTGFYAQPIPNYGVPIYYGPLDGPDFLIYKRQMDRLNSKNSLSNASADDVQKYRDVQL